MISNALHATPKRSRSPELHPPPSSTICMGSLRNPKQSSSLSSVPMHVSCRRFMPQQTQLDPEALFLNTPFHVFTPPEDENPLHACGKWHVYVLKKLG